MKFEIEIRDDLSLDEMHDFMRKARECVWGYGVMRNIHVPQKQNNEPTKQWEPKGGNWLINSIGDVVNIERFDPLQTTDNKMRNFGILYQSEHAAEFALDCMRRHNRLLNYVFEHMDIKHDNFTHTVYAYGGVYDVLTTGDDHHDLGAVLMPEHVAEKLCNDLNSGRYAI